MARAQVAISTQMVAGHESIMVWDVTTGNILTTYKTNDNNSTKVNLLIPCHCIDRIGYQYLINGYQNSPIIHVWSLHNKDHLYLKMTLPGNVRTLCVSNDGCYCLVGIQTCIYIWQISSGYLLNIIDKHFQPIRVIKITNDMSYFITGGEDGKIMIWNFSKFLVESDETFSVQNGQSSQEEPDEVIDDFSMPIIDIYLGNGGRQSKFAVCGEYYSYVNIYQLPRGIILAKIKFPDDIVSVVLNRIESSLFCGSINGDIFQVQISKVNSIDFISNCLTFNKDKDNMQKFSGHNKSVCSLAITIDGQSLISGSDDCTIKKWHILSHKCMQTITCKGPVSNLVIHPSLSGIFLTDSLDSSNYLIPNNSQAVDISMKNNNKPQSSFNSNFSKPSTLEQILHSLPNPSIPILPFERNKRFRLIYNPNNLINQISVNNMGNESLNRTKFNAFDNGGCLYVRNDSMSSKEFWPWSNFNYPEPEDLKLICSTQKIEQMKLKQDNLKSNNNNNNLESMRTNNDENGTVLNNNNNNNNNAEDEMAGQNEIEPIESSNSAQQLDKIAELRKINFNLYQYMIENILKNN